MNFGNKIPDTGHTTYPDFLTSLDGGINAPYPIAIYPPVDADSDAQTHHHRLIELIVNFTDASGVITAAGRSDALDHLVIGETQCCMVPAGICHSLVVENRHRHVSLFVDASLISTRLGECIPGVAVQSLRSLAWGDLFTTQLVAELNGRAVVYEDSILTRSMLTTLAVKLIDGFVRIYDEQACPERGMSVVEKIRAHSYIEERLEQKFCVAGLAKHMGMSLAHLNRRFRVSFSSPPLQYALKLRVDKALALLRSGDARVAEAAFSVGFCDQSHFDRHCRKFYGFPPGALIRAAR